MARCIQELERIKGIQNGGDRKSDIAEELNIDQRQLQNWLVKNV